MKKVNEILQNSVFLRLAWLRDREQLSMETLEEMAVEKSSFLSQWAQKEIERRRK